MDDTDYTTTFRILPEVVGTAMLMDQSPPDARRPRVEPPAATTRADAEPPAPAE